MNCKNIIICIAIVVLGIPAIVTSKNRFSNESDAFSYAESLDLFSIEDTTEIEISTLEQLLELAEKRSPEIRAAYFTWKSSLYQTQYSGTLSDPMFTVGFFGESVETRVGPQERRYSIKQQIPWFGNLGKEKNIAFAQSNIRFQNYLNARKKVFYNISDLYFQLYLQYKKISLAHENLKLLEYLESVARTKYKVNDISKTDLLKIQMEIDKLNNELVDLDYDLQPINAEISNHVNLTQILINAPENIQDTDSLSYDDLKNKLAQNNRDLQALTFLIEKETESKRLADKSSYPSFTIGADYIETGDAINPSLSESGKDAWMVSVGINIPLWFSKNSSKKQEAQQKIHLAEATYDLRKNQLQTVLEKLMNEYAKLSRELELLNSKLLPKSKQIVEISVKEYQNNTLDISDLLQYQRELLNLQYSFEESIVKRKIIFEKINYLTSE